MVWEPALIKFSEQIIEKGYYHWEHSFQDFKKQFTITANQRAPTYLSLDFYCRQRPELTNRGWYVIRLGQGNFGIFDEAKYAKPYLDLPIDGSEEIQLRKINSHRSLRKSFKSLDLTLKSAENTLLELARFYNIFETMVNEIDGASNFHVGPRGGMTQQFPLCFKKQDSSLLSLEYDGQVELDYSIWTENRVFVIEAKSLTRQGRDIGWHKMAFPTQRFINEVHEEDLKINPVYFLRTRVGRSNVLMLYVFDEMEFHKGGIILNDENRWKLLKVFSVNIDQLDEHLR